MPYFNAPCASWFRILLLVCLLAGCGREPLYQSQSYVFGTLVDISIYGEPEQRARLLASHVEQDFQRLHSQLHAWKPGGELYRLNSAFAEGRRLPLSPELAAILLDATQLSERSGGIFNPAIGGLINLWGFQRDEFTPLMPDPQQIQALIRAAPHMSDIVIENGLAWSRNRSVRVDLGGYAKGYALDRAAAYLRQEKVHGALINIGGNILALGMHGERPWRVGIQHPRQPGPMALLDLPDGWAIGTSGDYQRYFELDGKRYCHLIDPRSGYPAQGVQEVTILVPPGEHAGTLSDAASKPLFITGPAGWRRAAGTMGIDYAMLVDAGGGLHMTRAMRQHLQLVVKNVPLEILP
ncbi:thiamine biosynthesis lipoprotein ApbE precursor [mine drainage metagenome]|uniref:FAD:protein FMN transferase n=1 Tax=mine drainage metagenome TaxID=410659 RepID=A0A1J5QAY7_9ZZZZ